MSSTTFVRVDTKFIVIPGIVQIASQCNHIVNSPSSMDRPDPKFEQDP